VIDSNKLVMDIHAVSSLVFGGRRQRREL
jgi:hypothetical protein